MNEQIEELYAEAKQATKIGRMNAPSGVVAKKFAELIVAECGVALSPMLRDQISRGKAFDLIKQHFGVEE